MVFLLRDHTWSFFYVIIHGLYSTWKHMVFLLSDHTWYFFYVIIHGLSSTWSYMVFILRDHTWSFFYVIIHGLSSTWSYMVFLLRDHKWSSVPQFQLLQNYCCVNWRIKNQLDTTFFVLLIGSTCFGLYHAHHQELATMMLITTLVVSFLVCCMLEVRCG